MAQNEEEAIEKAKGAFLFKTEPGRPENHHLEASIMDHQGVNEVLRTSESSNLSSVLLPPSPHLSSPPSFQRFTYLKGIVKEKERNRER